VIESTQLRVVLPNQKLFILTSKQFNSESYTDGLALTITWPPPWQLPTAPWQLPGPPPWQLPGPRHDSSDIVEVQIQNKRDSPVKTNEHKTQFDNLPLWSYIDCYCKLCTFVMFQIKGELKSLL